MASIVFVSHHILRILLMCIYFSFVEILFLLFPSVSVFEAHGEDSTKLRNRTLGPRRSQHLPPRLFWLKPWEFQQRSVEVWVHQTSKRHVMVGFERECSLSQADGHSFHYHLDS